MLRLLEALRSDDPRVREPAEARLREAAQQRGFHGAVLDLMTQPSAPQPLRSQCYSVLKLSFQRFWRASEAAAAVAGTVCVPNEEKDSVRERLSVCWETQDTHASRLLAYAFAILADRDFPERWPSLFDQLLQGLQRSPDAVAAQKLLFTLHQTLKHLERKSHHWDTRVMHRAISPLFSLVSTRLQQCLPPFVAQLANPADPRLPAVTEGTLLLVKCLQRLALYLDLDNLPEPELRELVQRLLRMAAALRPARSALTGPLRGRVEKFICVVAASVRRLQERHPVPFRVALAPAAEFFLGIIRVGKRADGEFEFERLLVEALGFARAVLSCEQYRHPEEVYHDPLDAPPASPPPALRTARQEAVRERERVFDEGVQRALASHLVSSLMTLTPSELNLWRTDALAFHHFQQPSDHSGRARHEVLLLFDVLCSQEGGAAIDTTMALLGKIVQTGFDTQKEDLQSVLLRSSVYLALGLAPLEMTGALAQRASFQQLFERCLAPDLRSADAMHAITRRGALLLLGDWSDHIDDAAQPTIFAALVRSLSEPNLAVRLAATRALHNVSAYLVRDNCRGIATELLDPALTALFDVVAKVDDPDVQVTVLNTVGSLIEGAGPLALGPAHRLVPAMVALWRDASIVTVRLALLVIAELLALVAVTREEAGMGEEAAALWLEVLRNSIAMDASFIRLFVAFWASLVETELALVPVCMKILDSYALLGGEPFLREYGKQIGTVLASLTGEISPAAQAELFPPMDTMLALAPRFAPQVLLSVLAIWARRIASYRSDAGGGDGADGHGDAEEDEEAAVDYGDGAADAGIVARLPIRRVLAEAVSLFARPMFECPDVAITALQAASDGHGRELIGHIVRVSLELRDYLPVFGKRKLTTLAICNSLATGEPGVLRHLDEVIDLCVAVQAAAESSAPNNMLPSAEEARAVPMELRVESARRQLLATEDPALRASVPRHLVLGLRDCERVLGPERFRTVLESLTPFARDSLAHLRRKAALAPGLERQQ